MAQAFLEGLLKAMAPTPGFTFKYSAFYYAGKLLVGCSTILSNYTFGRFGVSI